MDSKKQPVMFGEFHQSPFSDDSEECNPFLALEVLLSGISYLVDGIVSTVIYLD